MHISLRVWEFSVTAVEYTKSSTYECVSLAIENLSPERFYCGARRVVTPLSNSFCCQPHSLFSACILIETTFMFWARICQKSPWLACGTSSSRRSLPIWCAASRKIHMALLKGVPAGTWGVLIPSGQAAPSRGFPGIVSAICRSTHLIPF